MVSKSAEFSIRPSVHDDSGEKSRSSFESHLGKLLENLHVSILEHRRNDLLLKGRQVLTNLSIDLIMLLPKLSTKKE